MKDGELAEESLKSISLIIPFYNEESGIARLRERLAPVIEKLGSQRPVQLVLVDDGSADLSYPKLVEHFAHCGSAETVLLRHARNRGIGAAMATGFDAATGDVVCTLDSDCTYAPEELPALIALLHSSGADIATGSPYHPMVSLEEARDWRIRLSRAASRLWGLLLPAKLHCYTSFFRAYRSEWANKALFSSNGFLAVTEILVAAACRGARIVEYPVALGLRSNGRSKMRPLRVALDHLRLMGKTLLRSSAHSAPALGARES